MKLLNTSKISLKALALVFTLSLLTACGGGDGGEETASGGDGEGGIIGTAKIIVKSDGVKAKSITGNSYNAKIESDNKYTFKKLKNNTYLLRIKTSSTYLYSIAHVRNGKQSRSNVHPLTDLIIRNWFATKKLDIDKEFNGNHPISKLPTVAEINAIESAVEGIVSQLLKVSGINNGVDLIGESFETTDKDNFNKFLEMNQVVLTNNNVTLVFGVGNQIQGISIDNINISTDFTKDTEAPMMPTSLRALAASQSEIVIVWEASTDNRGVAGYDVFRNGKKVATTPYPVYTDIGLKQNIPYVYTVEAIDGAKNKSGQIVSTNEVYTLNTADTVAPPAATELNTIVTGNSIRLTWTQDNIYDVSSFIIKRGGKAIARITSTSFTDFNLSGPATYCYSVISVDAANNQSVESSDVCAVVTSTGSGGNNPPVRMTKPTRPSSCITLGFSRVDQDTTLDKPCYNVADDLAVNARLIIKPGVWIEFAEGTKLQINEKGSLYSVGTRTQPIVFTGKQLIPGYWTGINYTYSKSVNNRMDYTFVEYAETNIDTYGSGTTYPVRLNIKNSILQNASNLGLHINNKNNLIDAFSDNIITGNARGISMPATLVGRLDKSSSYKGNTDDLIHVFNESISYDQTWKKLDVDFFLWSRGVNYSIDADLILEAGVKLIFNEGTGLNVNEYGSLKAVGTTRKNIILTGLQDVPGYWRGIKYNYSKNANNIIDHAVIEYGVINIDTYASGSTYPVWLNIKNTTLQNASDVGINIHNKFVRLLGFQRNKITGNALGINLPADLVGNLDKQTTYTGNTDDRIHVFQQGNIKIDQTWKKLDADYFLWTKGGVKYQVHADLKIEAGVNLIFQASSGLHVYDDGSLNAIGTSSQPITFTGLQKVAGYWNSIRFNYSNSVLNILDNVIVQYAGASGNGSIVTTCIGTTYPNQLTIKNSEITHSDAWGIYNGSNGGTCTLTESGNLFANNKLGDIRY